jgi:hypothetical protein
MLRIFPRDSQGRWRRASRTTPAVTASCAAEGMRGGRSSRPHGTRSERVVRPGPASLTVLLDASISARSSSIRSIRTLRTTRRLSSAPWTVMSIRRNASGAAASLRSEHRWLCISVRESFRGDCGSHLLTEFAMSVCFDVTQGLAVGRWGVLLPQGALWGSRSRRSICTPRSVVTTAVVCRSGLCSASTTSPGGRSGGLWTASGQSPAGSSGAGSPGWIPTSL